MSNTLVQFRTEEKARLKAVEICERLGMDLPTYLRICVYRLNEENGIPFSMKLDKPVSANALDAMKRASAIAEENGFSDMSLDEINAEIAAARELRRE